ncbi:VOC family protein [Luteibaculum oceani]|uniref:Glyoxalase n=1 Tax=Luteibaculum oceani TaxID=1294296 RepID=A0A5C6V5N1_9FLAO|nr:VOC family protein [Luteibaculum oceani]TXC78995.1 glyoxalase [Luteibaculum oceani]
MKTNAASLSLSGITEVCLYSSDLSLSKEFYCDKLGFRLISESESHLFFKVENQVLLIFDPDKSKEQDQLPAHFAHGNQHIAFEVYPGEYEVWKEKLKNLGIEIIKEQFWGKSKLRSFYFCDPDSHVLEILEGNIWASL